MIEKYNFDTFFPIQIWEFKEQGLYRFQPPRLGFDTTYEFYDHFIDSIPAVPTDEASYVRKNWRLRATFWAFNPRYALYLSRGFVWLFVQQQDVFPFSSKKIGYIQEFDLSIDQIYTGLSLVAYIYNIPDTRLLFISSNFNLDLMDALFLDDKDDPLIDFYNFLPAKKNKDIPFYKLNNSFYRNYLLYVYEERPRELYWGSNSENLCYPSANSGDYMTIFECLKNNVSRLAFDNLYLESNYDPVNLVMGGSKKKSVNLILIFIFIFCIFLFSIFALIYIR